MKTFRITYAEASEDVEGNVEAIFHAYMDIVAHSYESPRPGKHIFKDENGAPIATYFDGTIASVDEL